MFVNYRAYEFNIAHYLGFYFAILILFHFCQSLLDVKDTKAIFDLGKHLTERLTDSPSGKKEDIINDLTDYYIYLNTAFRVGNKSFPSGKKVLQKLKAKGGPPFLNVDIKDDMLESKYEMELVEVDHVKEVIEDIDRLWRDICKEVLVPPELEYY